MNSYVQSSATGRFVRVRPAANNNTNKTMKRILTILALTVAVAGAKADESFLQLSLTPDIAIQSRETRINGISLNIWGENPQSAFTLGFVNGSTGESKGFTWGIWNYSESYSGVQWGIVNHSKTKFVGWQNGWVNIAKEFHGFQSGLINYTESMSGIQIGFVNIINDNPWFEEFPNKLAKGFVFVNWSF